MSEQEAPSIDDYELLCVIGRGCYGKIYLVRELKTAQVYAMKVVKKKLIEEKNKLKYIFTERNALIEVHFSLYLSSNISLSSKSSPAFKMKPNFTSSWSTVPEENSITCSPSSRNFQKNSNCIFIF